MSAHDADGDFATPPDATGGDDDQYASTAYAPAVQRADSWADYQQHEHDQSDDGAEEFAPQQPEQQQFDQEQDQDYASHHAHADSQTSSSPDAEGVAMTSNEMDPNGSISARALAMGSSDFQRLADRLQTDHDSRVSAVMRAGGAVVQPKRRPQTQAAPAPSPARAAFVAGQPLLPSAGGSNKRSAWPLDESGNSGKKKLPQLQPKDSRHLFAGGTLDFASPDGKRGRNGVDPALLAAIHAPLAAPPAYQQHTLAAVASMPALTGAAASPGHRKSHSSLSDSRGSLLQSRPSTLQARPSPSAHVDDPIALKEQLLAARRSLAATEKQLVQSRTENQKLQVAVKRGQKELTEVLARKIGEGCDTPSGGLQLIKSERQLISGLIAKMRDLEQTLASLEDEKAAAAREAQEQQARLLHASQSALFFENEAKRLMELLSKAKAHRDLSRFLAGKSNRDAEARQDSRELEQTLVEFHQQENRELVAANDDLRKQAARAKKQEARWALTEQQYISNLKEARALIQETFAENEALRKELTQAHAALRGASGEVGEREAQLASAIKSESVALTRCNKLTNEVAALTTALNIKKEAFLRLATAYRSIGGKHSAYEDGEEWELASGRASTATSPTGRRGKSRSPKRSAAGFSAGSRGTSPSRPATAESRVVASFVAASTPHSRPRKLSPRDNVDIYAVDDEEPRAAPAKARPASAAHAGLTKEKPKTASALKPAEKVAPAPKAAATPKAAAKVPVKPSPAKAPAAASKQPAKAEEKRRSVQPVALPSAPMLAPAPAEPESESDAEPEPTVAPVAVAPIPTATAPQSQQSTPRDATPAPVAAPVPTAAPPAATPKPVEPAPSPSSSQLRPSSSVAADADRTKTVAPPKSSAAPVAVGCDTCMAAAVLNCVDCDGPYCQDCFDDLHESTKMKAHKTQRVGQDADAQKKQSSVPAATAADDDDDGDIVEAASKPIAPVPAAQSVLELLATKKRPVGSAGVRSDYKGAQEPVKAAVGVAPLCTHCASALVSVVCDECSPPTEFCAECDEETHVHRQRKTHQRRPFVLARAAAAPAKSAAPIERTQWQSDPGVPVRTAATLLCEVCESAMATVRCAQCQEGMRCVCAECDEALHAVKASAAHKRAPIGSTIGAIVTPAAVAAPSKPVASVAATVVADAPLCSFCVENLVSLICSSGCGEVCAECSVELHARGSTRQHIVKPIDTAAAAAAPAGASQSSSSGVRVERQVEANASTRPAAVPDSKAPSTAAPAPAPAVAVQPTRAADDDVDDNDLDASYGVDDFDDDEPAATVPRAAAAAPAVQGKMGGGAESEESSESESDDDAVVVAR